MPYQLTPEVHRKNADVTHTRRSTARAQHSHRQPPARAFLTTPPSTSHNLFGPVNRYLLCCPILLMHQPEFSSACRNSSHRNGYGSSHGSFHRRCHGFSHGSSHRRCHGSIDGAMVRPTDGVMVPSMVRLIDGAMVP